MLTVIVGSVKELVNPYAAGEVILIFRSFKELLYAPFQALDINLRFCINLPLAVIGGVGRRSDHMVVVDCGNRHISRFLAARKELVERFPTPFRHLIVSHIITGRIIIAFYSFIIKRLRLIHPCSE